MELALNLGWMFLTVLMCGLWVRHAPRDGANRGVQFVALALVILILFPVISVTDDIMTAQNPAETDCCLRKDHVCPDTHSTLHPVLTGILPSFADLSPDSSHFVVQGNHFAPAAKTPARDPIQNRPPPTA